MANIERVLRHFNEEKQSFGYNPEFRNSVKKRINVISETDQSDLEYENEVMRGQKELSEIKTKIIASDPKQWASSRRQFRKGDAKQFLFNTADDEVTIKPNRFSGTINIRRELQATKQRKTTEQEKAEEENRMINRAEWQHMSYVVHGDSSTRRIVRQRKKTENMDANYDREHETGNTHRVTKERSMFENEDILRRNADASIGEEKKRFHISTTLIQDDDGNSIECDYIMNKQRLDDANTNVEDDGEYKNSINRVTGL